MVAQAPAPHEGTARAHKNCSVGQVPGTNSFGDGGHQLTPLGLPCPGLYCLPPPMHSCSGCGDAKGGEMLGEG